MIVVIWHNSIPVQIEDLLLHLPKQYRQLLQLLVLTVIPQRAAIPNPVVVEPPPRLIISFMIFQPALLNHNS
ncbi:hypothetical protein ACETAC_05980 [Aceticella autotrophica]|uniref:Uncharacterized protein n=1 Tax=Aceticella autotrophica TaxID=2755338 RepID=A0A974Y2N3_9THEO|nr:hypothetical protein [Aceticella autotrophica]QSZ26473.1 hypothetical protein ACETAC_05980 [Aceticella autotrophica]